MPAVDAGSGLRIPHLPLLLPFRLPSSLLLLDMMTRRMEYTETTTRREVRQVPHYPERDMTNRRSVSSEDMRGMGSRHGLEKDVVEDTLAALVTDVNQTAEILRRGSSRPRDDPPNMFRSLRAPRLQFPDIKAKNVVRAPPPPQEPEVQYKLRIAGGQMSAPSPAPSSNASTPFPGPKRRTPGLDERCSVERVCQDFGIPMPDDSLRKRGRSETPGTRRMIRVESSMPPADGPICAACNEVVRGPCITALAPNSERAQKFHPEHFVCTYCQKSLNSRGTYKEHDKKPYCHDCFYKLYSGHIYSDPNARPR